MVTNIQTRAITPLAEVSQEELSSDDIHTPVSYSSYDGDNQDVDLGRGEGRRQLPKTPLTPHKDRNNYRSSFRQNNSGEIIEEEATSKRRVYKLLPKNLTPVFNGFTAAAERAQFLGGRYALSASMGTGAVTRGNPGTRRIRDAHVEKRGKKKSSPICRVVMQHDRTSSRRRPAPPPGHASVKRSRQTDDSDVCSIRTASQNDEIRPRHSMTLRSSPLSKQKMHGLPR